MCEAIPRAVCAARPSATIAARNFARAVASGSSAHSDHGRGMALALLAVAKGEARSFRIRDEAKLHAVAGYLGIKTGDRPAKTSPSTSPRQLWPSSAGRPAN